MNIIINLGEKESSITTLEQLGHNEYVPFDVQITNSHITDLNKLVGRKLFKNSLLYISFQTLHDLMQPVGGKKQHNYHGLTPEDVYIALTSIKDPQCVFVVKEERYALLSIELSHFDLPLMMVIETDSNLIENKTASISKVVTIYPRGDIDKYLEKIDQRLLLYMKK